MTQSTTRSNYESKPIPPELGETSRKLLGIDEAPSTLGEWTAAARAVFEGLDAWPPSIGMLCSADSSRHTATIDGETRHFHCTLDGLLVPHLSGDAVEMESVCPTTGTEITVEVSETTIETTPEDAVMSFGFSTATGTPETVHPGIAYQYLCPYVNAFASREDYERWAGDIPNASTVAVPFPEAAAFARDLVAPATE